MVLIAVKQQLGKKKDVVMLVETQSSKFIFGVYFRPLLMQYKPPNKKKLIDFGPGWRGCIFA